MLSSVEFSLSVSSSWVLTMPMYDPGALPKIGSSWRAFVTVPAAYWTDFSPLFKGLGAVESLFECGESESGELMWRIEGLFSTPPANKELEARAAVLATSVGMPEPLVIVEKVESADWMTDNVAAFPPFQVGRFYIHGDHNKGPFPCGALRLKLNAATAFGSGEHGSTRGCLLALDGLRRRDSGLLRSLIGSRYGKISVLDMGCGTGILAISAAKAWNCGVLAVDIDPEAVRVTQYNIRANGVSDKVRTRLSDGPVDVLLKKRAPYALITANILARPLVNMARRLSNLLRPGGYIVLSGIMENHESMVCNAYRAQGLRLVRRYSLSLWSTLVMKRGRLDA